MKNKVLRLPSNDIGRDFVVGDLHGCYSALMKMLTYLKFDQSKDRLFSVGDLIDRGTQNIECLNLIDQPWFYVVEGNHENMMWETCKGKHGADGSYTEQIWLSNGGSWIIPMIDQYPNILDTLCDRYLANLPIVIVVGEGQRRFNIVHAEFYNNKRPVSDSDIDNWTFTPEQENSMIWGRTIIHNGGDNLFHDDLSPTYVGHTPIRNVVAVQRQIYIDTGCVFAQRRMGMNTEYGLTIAEPATGKYWTSFVSDPERSIGEFQLPSCDYDPTNLRS